MKHPISTPARPSSLSTVRVVLFDAVGTLIRPQPSAADAYHAAAMRWLVNLSKEQIAARFPIALARHTQDSDSPTDESHERHRWRKIVADVFSDSPDKLDDIFESLWSHFADARHWIAFDDAQPAWHDLEERGLTLGVASNFDGRLNSICASLPWLREHPRIFCSSQVGYSKPNRKFFEAIGDRLAAPADRILLVGDDRANDYEAARAAGWRAVWLDRRGSPAAAGESKFDKIGSLRELAELFQSG